MNRATRWIASVTLLAVLSLAQAACTQPKRSNSDGNNPDQSRWFWSPEGIAATNKHVLVANTAFYLDGQKSRWGQGFLTVIDRDSRAVVARLNSSAPNPRTITVRGQRAYLLCAGEIEVRDGLARPTTGGAVDIIDLSASPPKVISTIALGLNKTDDRIGAYAGLVVDAEGRRALVGSGTRGDLFMLDLQAGKPLRGAQRPIELFPTRSGENGMTVLRPWGTGIAALDFNSERLCLGEWTDDEDWDHARERSCHAIKVSKNQLSGPIDLARAPDGRALVLMTLTNALYSVDLTASPALTRKVASTGLSATRLIVHGEMALILNALSANLQRVDLVGDRDKNPLGVFPTASNPTDMVITTEPEGEVAWVTLFGSHEVAIVSLETGEVIQTIISSKQEKRDADVDSDGGSEAAAADAGTVPPSDAEQQSVVGIAVVEQTRYGDGAGFGQSAMPEVVQGGPQGSTTGGADVVSLGVGGEIIVSFGAYDIVDGPGVDFIVFENPMALGPCASFAEPGIVGVSTNRSTFVDFPCDLEAADGDPDNETWAYPGCAGVRPVLANIKTNAIAADDPQAAGGDAFDLADLSVTSARYLRIKDAGVSMMGSDSKGFDLDAIVLINYSKR